jgi:hypothetical protein
MELIKHAGGSDEDKHTSVLFDNNPISSPPDDLRIWWTFDRVYPEHEGILRIALKGAPSTGSPPDHYSLKVRPSELGEMLGKMRSEDVQRVMDAFLERADPEIIGALVGWVITHLAHGRAK